MSESLGLEVRAIASSDTAARRGEVSWCSQLLSREWGSLRGGNNPTVNVLHLSRSAGGWTASPHHRRLPAARRGGYETVLPDGTYPEPTDRTMFGQGPTRGSEAYFTPQTTAFADELKTAAGVVIRSRPSSPDRPSQALLVDVADVKSDAAIDAAKQRMSTGVEWMADAERLDQRRTMTVSRTTRRCALPA